MFIEVWSDDWGFTILNIETGLTIYEGAARKINNEYQNRLIVEDKVSEAAMITLDRLINTFPLIFPNLELHDFDEIKDGLTITNAYDGLSFAQLKTALKDKGLLIEADPENPVIKAARTREIARRRKEQNDATNSKI